MELYNWRFVETKRFKEKINMEIVNLLWTGGWDSTFRLLQLSEKEVEIKIFYFIDKKRKSASIEIKRMQKILEEIKNLKNSKAKINNINYIEVDTIKNEMKNKKITDASKYLVEKYKIGTQYEWFALFCNYSNIDMEIGVEKPLSTIGEAIYGEKGKLIEIKEEKFNNRLRIETLDKTSSIYYLMKNFIFPLTTLTKKDMEKIAKEKEWIEIMKLTWFCHQPINNKPCGYCNPCQDAMKYGMSWRMPLISKIRYYILYPIKLIYRMIKK